MISITDGFISVARIYVMHLNFDLNTYLNYDLLKKTHVKNIIFDIYSADSNTFRSFKSTTEFCKFFHSFLKITILDL